MAEKLEIKAKEKVDEIVTAVYKVNLHCEKCAQDIKKPLLCVQGVHGLEIDYKKSEIKVKGRIDVIKIQKRIEKLSKKKVELISPQVKIKNVDVKEKVVKETKEAIVRTTSVKVHMHCDKCEIDLRNRLLKHQGIFSVKTNIKKQNLIIEGTITSDKLLAYIRKKVHKNAEIISSKPEKVEEKVTVKEKQNVVVKSTDIVEFKTEKKIEAKTVDGNVPYFVHYVYAPQMFSDENPNACIVM